MTTLPDGFAVRLSTLATAGDGGRTLVGGSRGSALFLSADAAARLATGDLVVGDDTDRRLARRLLDAGMVDPVLDRSAASSRTDRAGSRASRGDVTVVVPVRDRTFALDRLLRTIAVLDPGVPVVVVDDGSRDPRAVAVVAERHGARLVRHVVNRGPAAARNTGLAAVATAYVCFCDSDVVPTAGWLTGLAEHFADPAVGLVAPRVLGQLPQPGDGAITRYEQVRSSLDLGPTPAAVRPATPVSYVPSACLAGRMTALRDGPGRVGDRGGFDERLRVAEDVDLVWALVEAGWTVRYEPGVQVRHDHRARPRAWLARKAYYGTGAAPLARRHGPAVAPLVLAPWSVLAVVAVLAQRRWSLPVAVVSAGVATVRLRRRLDRAERPWALAATLVGRGCRSALAQTGQSLVRHHWPLWLAAGTRSARVRRALLLAVLLDGARDTARRDAQLSWPAWMLLRRLDDAAYGAGVWWGAWRERSVSCLVPRVTGRSASSDPHGRFSGRENLSSASLDASDATQSAPSGATTEPDSSQTQTGSGPPRSGWM